MVQYNLPRCLCRTRVCKLYNSPAQPSTLPYLHKHTPASAPAIALNSSRLLPSSLQPFKCGNLLSHPSARSHIPPRIQAACKSNGAKDQRRPPFQLRPRSPSFVSACVYACGERSRSHCPECRGCRTPSGVLPSPECQGLRQASGTRLSVLQPSGAWLALHRWLEVILVIKRRKGPHRVVEGRRAYICAEQTQFRFGLFCFVQRLCIYRIPPLPLKELKLNIHRRSILGLKTHFTPS